MSHPTRELAKWLAIVPTVVLTIYFGSYFALVNARRKPVTFISHEPVTIAHARVPVFASNFSVDFWLTLLFAPAHKLDQRLRPEMWRTTVDRLASSRLCRHGR